MSVGARSYPSDTGNCYRKRDTQPPSDAALSPIPTKRIIAGRSGPPDGAQGSGVDSLLLSFQGVGVPTCRRIPRQGHRPLGHEEIQALARSQASGVRLAWPCEAESAGVVRALVRLRRVLGWNNGSPVSREIHAGFCEQPRGRFPRLTQPWYGRRNTVIRCWEVKSGCAAESCYGRLL